MRLAKLCALAAVLLGGCPDDDMSPVVFNHRNHPLTVTLREVEAGCALADGGDGGADAGPSDASIGGAAEGPVSSARVIVLPPETSYALWNFRCKRARVTIEGVFDAVVRWDEFSGGGDDLTESGVVVEGTRTRMVVTLTGGVSAEPLPAP